MLTYTTMKGGVLAVDHFPTLVSGIVIAEDACSSTSMLSASTPRLLYLSHVRGVPVETYERCRDQHPNRSQYCVRTAVISDG